MTRRPELDGIRGLAILLVLVGHVDSRLEGFAYAGLSLFFVLSGYLITGVLQRTPNRRTFYLHRVARLAPALIVTLGAVSVFGGSTQILATAFYLGNVPMAAGGSILHDSLGHTWSLGVEEQFYLVWPWLLALMRPRWLVAVGLASLALRFVIADPYLMYYATFTRLDGLAFGAALALTGRRFGAGWLGLLALLGSGLVGVGVIVPALAVDTFASVVIVAAAPMYLRFLAPLGRISYSLYLYHWPLLLAFGLPGLALAVPLAVVSTLVLEEPLRRLLRHDQPIGERRRPVEGARSAGPDAGDQVDLPVVHGDIGGRDRRGPVGPLVHGIGSRGE